MPAKPLLFLIDGSSQMYRAYHAPIRTADGALLHNAQGTPTRRRRTSSSNTSSSTVGAGIYAGLRTTRPGRAPVGSPRWRTGVPATITCSMPTEKRIGSAKVA